MNKLALFLFRILIFFEICLGAHAWFTWWITSSMFITCLSLAVFVLIAFFYRKIYHFPLSNSIYIKLGFAFFLLGVFFSSNFSILGTLLRTLILYPIWVLLSDKPERVRGHLDFVIRVLAVILVFGLVEYFVFTAIPLPGIPIQYGESDNYIFLNYGFYLRNVGDYALRMERAGTLQRFTSVFLEPGYLSTILVFLLYAVNFDLSKRANRVLLYTILVCLSLAGYVMLIMAYFFHLLQKRKSILFLVPVSLFLLITYFIAINYNGGDNYLNSEIVERLVPDKEVGIAGNNRTSELTREYFYRGLLNGDSFFGLGQERVDKINGGKMESYDHNAINGTGAIYFFVVFGIISALFYYLFYHMIGRYSRTRPYSSFFVLLIIVCFIQASYPDSTSWIYPFVLGIKNYQNEVKKTCKNLNYILANNA